MVDMEVATNSTITTVENTNCRRGSGHKQYTLIVEVRVATNSTPTREVHFRRGSDTYTYYSSTH